MRFRPCIDLHGGKVKQIVGSSLTDSGERLQTNFESELDSAWYAGLYRRDGLTGGHVIMLGPGNTEAALRALQAYPGGLQLGGGITPENAERFLEAGAERVIVTSYVFSGGELRRDRLEELCRRIGADKLVLDLSCRRRDGAYRIVTDRWQKFTDLEVTPELLRELAPCCSEYLVHAVEVEGRQSGVDLELVRILAASPRPVVYAGGIATLAELEQIRAAGADRVDFTVGSALDLFGGPLPYARLKEYR